MQIQSLLPKFLRGPQPNISRNLVNLVENRPTKIIYHLNGFCPKWQGCLFIHLYSNKWYTKGTVFNGKFIDVRKRAAGGNFLCFFLWSYPLLLTKWSFIWKKLNLAKIHDILAKFGQFQPNIFSLAIHFKKRPLLSYLADKSAFWHQWIQS